MKIVQQQLESQLNETSSLLGNILPKHVLEQIKNGETTKKKEYACVTVFFSDITNYTVMAQNCSPTLMLDTLAKLWKEYDKISEKHNLFKVETIGDAFLGVTGCPEETTTHAQDAANFALELVEIIKEFRTLTNEELQIRIGLHSGPVTAGIMGDILRPKWCIVGDTVNTASRMETNSMPMKINISETTYRLLMGRYTVEKREPLLIKGKGTMQTYFLLNRKDDKKLK